MSISIDEINKLQEDNARLTKEVEQWKHEYEILDGCIEIYKFALHVYKNRLKEIRRIILVNKNPSLPLASVNAILDIITGAIGDNNERD